MKTSFRRKTLLLLLTAVMVITLLPMSALAEGEDPTGLDLSQGSIVITSAGANGGGAGGSRNHT
jgi:hypothetical protein